MRVCALYPAARCFFFLSSFSFLIRHDDTREESKNGRKVTWNHVLLLKSFTTLSWHRLLPKVFWLSKNEFHRSDPRFTRYCCDKGLFLSTCVICKAEQQERFLIFFLFTVSSSYFDKRWYYHHNCHPYYHPLRPLFLHSSTRRHGMENIMIIMVIPKVELKRRMADHWIWNQIGNELNFHPGPRLASPVSLFPNRDKEVHNEFRNGSSSEATIYEMDFFCVCNIFLFSRLLY